MLLDSMKQQREVSALQTSERLIERRPLQAEVPFHLQERSGELTGPGPEASSRSLAQAVRSLLQGFWPPFCALRSKKKKS